MTLLTQSGHPLVADSFLYLNNCISDTALPTWGWAWGDGGRREMSDRWVRMRFMKHDELSRGEPGRAGNCEGLNRHPWLLLFIVSPCSLHDLFSSFVEGCHDNIEHSFHGERLSLSHFTVDSLVQHCGKETILTYFAWWYNKLFFLSLWLYGYVMQRVSYNVIWRIFHIICKLCVIIEILCPSNSKSSLMINTCAKLELDEFTELTFAEFIIWNGLFIDFLLFCSEWQNVSRLRR